MFAIGMRFIPASLGICCSSLRSLMLRFAADAEIKLWIGSLLEPIEKKVNFETKIKPVLQILSNHVLNR